MGHLQRLIAFDLDGTLVDSRQDLADAANALLASLNTPSLPVPTIASMVGDGAAQLVARVLAAAGLAPAPEALPQFLAFYDERLLAHTRLYPGIAQAVGEAAMALGIDGPAKNYVPDSADVLFHTQLTQQFELTDVIGFMPEEKVHALI